MEKPNVQVLRFQNEDVIATSGGQSLISTVNYLALRSEAEQAKMGDVRDDSGGPWVGLNVDTLQSNFVGGVPENRFEEYSKTFQYAWFAGNQWRTNGETVKDLGYGYNSPLPTENPND